MNSRLVRWAFRCLTTRATPLSVIVTSQALPDCAGKRIVTVAPTTETCLRCNVDSPKLLFSSAYFSLPMRMKHRSMMRIIAAITCSRSNVRRRSCSSVNSRMRGSWAENTMSR